jgi:D-beta-D-heptose 7-phosphate kinase/D-beta-D-heptose 1-phosphate adenosyltransferase
MSAYNSKYLSIIDQFPTKKILVVGDFILDVYVKGLSTRLSPEAPVPVVDVAEIAKVPGGAANTAYNLKALSADVTLCSVLGTDSAADESMDLLKSFGINISCIIKNSERRTLVKTRVLAGDRVLVRYDEGSTDTITAITEQVLMELLEAEYEKYDAIIISDYNKGLITENLLEHLAQLQQCYKKFLGVDSKRLPIFSKLKPDFVKPNYEEVIKLFNLPYQYAMRKQQVELLGEKLFKKTQARIAAVTLDSDGSVIFDDGQLAHRCTAPDIPSANVSGAGDTFVSAFTLGYICSGEVSRAAEMATAAASVAVSKNETAACLAKELRCFFSQRQKCVYSLKDLEEICLAYRAEGHRIVFTNGCFDILHSGHVSYLNQARSLGDILIVGVNNDDSIRRLKGEGRPINPLEDRLDVLCGLTAVTHVIPFGEKNDDTPIALIKAVKPSVFVKGGDYTRDKLPEAETIDDIGGQIIFIPLIPDRSTTRIIDRIHTPMIHAT